MADRAVGAPDQDLGHRIGELAFAREHGGFAGMENVVLGHRRRSS
jgi:hypothetical protein